MKQYLASTLPESEYQVLDCLVTAFKEGETPISVFTLVREYQLLEEVGDRHDVATALGRLLNRGLVRWLTDPNDLGYGWLPTKLGVDTIEFKQSTFVEQPE